jgi:transposase
MTRAHYSAEFKANAVRRLSTPGQDALALASELGVHESLLYRWRRKAGTPSPMTKRPPPRRSAISTPSAIATPSATSTPQTASSTIEASEPRPKRRPQDWSDDEKITAVIESMPLTDEQLGGFLRQRGLYRATLDEWRESMLRGARAELGGHAAKKAEAAEAKRVRELERELSRKDKALAEMGALLVLQKKTRSLLGVADDDTEPPSGR